jgi:hypothetical protein
VTSSRLRSAGAWLACAAGALVLVLASRTAAARELELEWSAPEGCPTAALIQAEVARTVGRPWTELDSSWEKVRALVVPRAQRFELEVVLQATSGEQSERRVSAASCTEAGEAVVAILTTSIAPASDSAPVPPVVAGPSATSLPTPDQPPPPERGSVKPEPVLAANLGIDLGSLPQAAPFAQIVGGVALDRFSLLGFVGATSRVVARVPGTSAGADIALYMGGMLGCVEVLRTRVRPVACAGVEAGSLAASGFGTARRRDADAFWSAALARAALELGLGDRSAISLGVTAVVPFRQLRVVLEPEEVHRAPTIAARPWLGLGVRFQ